MVLARRLLLAAVGFGSFTPPGETMTADETAFWSDQAALLDPLAYVLYSGTSQTHTVGAGERDYLLGGWMIQAASSQSAFHRLADFRDAMPLSAGTALVTDASNAGSHMLICQPSLVTGSDARYSTDPRGLFFDRYQQMAELTQYELGVAATDGSTHTETFPTDFTYGLILHASAHDVAWVGLEDSGVSLTMNLMNEVSDADPIRFAQTILMPFDRTAFPKIKTRGTSLATGTAVVRYLKIGAW